MNRHKLRVFYLLVKDSDWELLFPEVVLRSLVIAAIGVGSEGVDGTEPGSPFREGPLLVSRVSLNLNKLPK